MRISRALSFFTRGMSARLGVCSLLILTVVTGAVAVLGRHVGDTWPSVVGITRIERVMTDNAKNYRLSHDFQIACQALGAR
ncbi:hypothetical protein QFZ82_002645 [Streptomyces sp. V4I23]|nr:hypothetical protein [Streptomyces sp. V4I23]